ncbi:MAG TPA: BACON domain-containing carbohydrate-binding protein, partial [Blastocatellia bacterium]|nr:BACON domain-containing carbohydrate-binding protein [Blastocatellia bacterium]
IDQGDSLKNREAEISTRLEKSYRDLEQGFETYKRKYEVSDADKTRSKAVEDTDKALQTFIDDTLNAKREMKWNEERLNLKGQEAAHAESLIVSEWSYVRRLIDDAEEKAFADPTDRESNGAKRRCIVRVTAIAPMTSPPDPPAPPLKLMDYLYFSIYTITTTGNGDIIPTTPYSKFLVSFANITEVIFLVVFFNALISLRSNTTSIFSTTQTFPAAGGTGTIYVTVPDGAKWRVPQDEDDAQQERREMLEIEKVTPPEHHGSRQIAYVVKENTLITKREAVLPLLDRTFTVVQEAAPIKYEIEVNLMAPLPPEECYYTLKIKSPDGCPWFVEPKFLNGKAGWLEIEAPQYGTGTATVRFKVHKTDTREPRKAFFVINGGKNQQEVVQSGGVLRVTLREELVNNAVVERVNGAGGPISLIVDAPGDLSWTASSDRDWITPRRARTGNGRQSPTFTVTENRTDERRDGTITIDEDGGAARNSIQVHIKQEAIKRGRNSGQ